MAATQSTDRNRESTGEQMDRFTLRIPEQQLEEVESLVDAGKYPNRSEAIRSAVRDMIREES